MVRQNKRIEYISDDNDVKDTQIHNKCSCCNKRIGKKSHETIGICNSCYNANNKENVRRKHSKSRTTKMARARTFKNASMSF